MIRRLTTLSLAAALLSATVGCRHNCGGGWFTSSSGSKAPCQLVGRSDVILDSTGMPIGGAPGMLIPGSGSPLAPGMYPGADLPYPQPADLIPRTGVPVPPAIPAPAPGPEGGANLLPPPKVGVPVKSPR